MLIMAAHQQGVFRRLQACSTVPMHPLQFSAIRAGRLGSAGKMFISFQGCLNKHGGCSSGVSTPEQQLLHHHQARTACLSKISAAAASCDASAAKPRLLPALIVAVSTPTEEPAALFVASRTDVARSLSRVNC